MLGRRLTAVGKPETSPWDEAGIERLVAPYLGDLAEPTSLSVLRYDLNAGVPDRASLPAAEIAEATARALRDDPAGALTYGGAQGYEPLRAWIAERHCGEGLAIGPEHVTLCSGSAHAIDNIAAAFLGAGDTAVVGAPTYPGAIRAFRARGAKLIDVPQDAQGLRPVALREALARWDGPPPKLLYLIPTYDNPNGSTMPLERREELLRIAEEHHLLIVEDDAYAGLDFDGPPPPSLFSLARGRGVLYVGTSSKTIATGLRLGWTVAAPEVSAASSSRASTTAPRPSSIARCSSTCGRAATRRTSSACARSTVSGATPPSRPPARRWTASQPSILRGAASTSGCTSANGWMRSPSAARLPRVASR